MAPIPGGAALRRLRTALEGVLNSWDVVLLDCPPSLGQLTVTRSPQRTQQYSSPKLGRPASRAWRR